MVRFENVSKTFVLYGEHKTVADNINVTFPAGVSVALLGRNGAGKSSLLEMVSGTVKPDSGNIVIEGSVSWPVGFGGSFHKELTGAQNVRFIARVYGIDTEELLDYVQDFADLGKHFHLPFRTYSSGMRARLAFGLSMGVHFDTYLVDEISAVGDAAFKAKSHRVFTDRLRTSGAIVVSHSMMMVREQCQAGAVLEDGTLTYYENLDEAIVQHEINMGVYNPLKGIF